ncbi:DUF4956 domain-containing protein [bacterium]|nr:DUF4956 domain-containing protein [bacterium]
MSDFLTANLASSSLSSLRVIFSAALAFILSVSIGLTYIKTFRGLSYSRNFVQAVMLSSIVTAMVIHAIGDSVAIGIGTLGALSIIRFRTNLKDPRDIIFLFAALAAGITCGIGAYFMAFVGIMLFDIAAFVLYFSQVSKASYFDGILRFNISPEELDIQKMSEILKKYCKVFALITLKEIAVGERLEYAYHIKMKPKKTSEELINELKAEIPAMNNVSLLLQETTVEL